MSLLTRAEEALKSHFEAAAGVGAPQRLQAAMAHDLDRRRDGGSHVRDVGVADAQQRGLDLDVGNRAPVIRQ